MRPRLYIQKSRMAAQPPSGGRRDRDARSKVHTLGTVAPRASGARHSRSSSPQKWEEKDVKFPGQNKKSLAATLLQVKGKKDMVVLCHGFASHRNSFHFRAIAEALANRQVGSLRIDFTGNGDSDGTFDFANYSVEAGDIRSAVHYLQSLGANVVGLVVNIAGRFDMQRGIKERFGEDIMTRLSCDNQLPMTNKRDDGHTINWVLTKWSLQDRLGLDMKAVSSRILCSEVCTVHGTKDTVIPIDDAYKFDKAIKHHRLCVVNGADHNFRSHASQMIELVLEHCCV